MDEHFSITRTIKGAPLKAPFAGIKKAALGTSYDLSLVFIGEKKSRALNRTYRGKDKATNVLSFPLDKRTGEIYITPSIAAREAKKFGMTVNNFIAYLFIHGLMHLKGMEHGSRMEKAELKFLKQFGIKK